jgi:hypothetical protein
MAILGNLMMKILIEFSKLTVLLSVQWTQICELLRLNLWQSAAS